ncbi:MAG: hypothetical protein R3C18_06945 [Planctomycetaceae bacterium]
MTSFRKRVAAVLSAWFMLTSLAVILPSARSAELAMVLDCSGSMSGEKLVHAREGAKLAVQMMPGGDRVAIIGFDDDAILSPWSGLN